MQRSRPGIAYQGMILTGLTVLIALTVGAGMVLMTVITAGPVGEGLLNMAAAAAFISIFAWFFALAAVLVFALPILIVLRRRRANQSIRKFLVVGAVTGGVAGLVLGFPMNNDLGSTIYFPLQGAASGLIAAWVWWKLVESRFQESPEITAEAES